MLKTVLYAGVVGGAGLWAVHVCRLLWYDMYGDPMSTSKVVDQSLDLITSSTKANDLGFDEKKTLVIYSPATREDRHRRHRPIMHYHNSEDGQWRVGNLQFVLENKFSHKTALVGVQTMISNSSTAHIDNKDDNVQEKFKIRKLWLELSNGQHIDLVKPPAFTYSHRQPGRLDAANKKDTIEHTFLSQPTRRKYSFFF